MAISAIRVLAGTGAIVTIASISIIAGFPVIIHNTIATIFEDTA
jgi:hypothetical protein